MRRLHIRRLVMKGFFVLVGLLLAGTIVAFLRSVSLWSILMSSLVFAGMILTFLLGIFTGSGPGLTRRKFRFTDKPEMRIHEPEIAAFRR